MRNFNSESFSPNFDFIEPTFDASLPLPELPEETIEKQTWKSRIHEKIQKVRESFGILKSIWKAGDEKRGHTEVQDTFPPQYVDTMAEDPFEEDGRKPKGEISSEEARKKILAEAYWLGKALVHDRKNAVGAITERENGRNHTTFPERNTTGETLPDTNMAKEMDNSDPFAEDEPASGFENARILGLEDLELKEKAKNARERIKKMIPNMIEKYDKLPLAGKLAVSGTLIAAGILANATGSTILAGTVYVAGIGLRGAGSYLMGRSAGRGLQNSLENTFAEGDALTKGEVFLIGATKLTVGLLAFAAGTWGSEYIRSVWPDFLNFTPSGSHTGNLTTAAVTSAHAPSVTPLPAVSDIVQPVPGIDLQGQVSAPGAVPSADQLVRHTNFVGIHEVVVRPGDTLTKVLLHGGIYEMFQPEEIAKLSWQGKQNLLANIVKNLSAEQLREVGISTGKANLLKLGDTIDVMKLAKIAKDITITVGGEKVPLLKRALELS